MLDKPIFICGFPKSGTTLIAQMFNNLPNVQLDIELHFAPFFLKMVAEAVNSGEMKSNVTDPLAMHLRQMLANDFEGYYEHCRRFFSGLHSGYAKGLRWGNNCKPTLDHVKPLLRMFPNATVINMLRDPRDVWASLKCAKWPGLEYFTDLNFFLQRYRKVYNYAQQDGVHTLLYRDLIANPQCAFDLINATFEPAYLKGTGKVFQQRTLPARFSEQFDDGIVENRNGRYLTELPEEEIIILNHTFADIIDRYQF